MASNRTISPRQDAAAVADGLRQSATRVRDWVIAGLSVPSAAADPGEAVDLLDTCGTILVLEGLGALDACTTTQREAWTQQLVTGATQRPVSGWAEDADLLPAVIHALDALAGRDPDRRVRRMDPALRLAVAGAAARPDWGEPNAASAGIEAALTACVLRAEAFDDPAAAGDLHAILDWLDDTQDPRTGLWGTQRGTEPRLAVAGTARLLPFFRYVGRPVARTGRMTDTLLMAVASGDFEGPRSLRDQLSLAEALATSLGHGRYRADEIMRLLTDMAIQTLSHEHSDGGHGNNDVAARSAPAPDRGRGWATWIRLATLARIAGALPDFADITWWVNRRWPGVGFAPRSKALTDHQRAVIDRWIRPVAPVSAGPRRARPTVTVVIPCFNLGLYLYDAVRSVKAQSLAEVELLIVDDGSDDEFTTRALAACEREGVTVLRQSNGGLAAARNTGVTRAAAPYICCLDADDRLRVDFLRRSVALLDSDSSIGFVNATMQWFDEADDLIRASPCELPDMLVYNRAIVAGVFRKSAWESVGGYFGGFSGHGIEDWDFWLQLLERGYRAGVIDDVLFDYRVRAGSMSHAMYEPDRWQALMRELAVRHSATFARYLPDVVAAMTRHDAEARAWAADRARAVTWWERKAQAWQQAAQDRERAIEDLKSWIRELEHGNAWLEQQRQRWEATARAAQAAAAADAGSDVTHADD